MPVKERVERGAERRAVKTIKKGHLRVSSPFVVGQTNLRECARIAREIFSDPKTDLERSVVQSFERLPPGRKRLIEFELNSTTPSGLAAVERELVARDKAVMERLIPGISPIKKQKTPLSVKVADNVFFQLTKRAYFTIRTLMLSPQPNMARLTGFLVELMLERASSFYKLSKATSIARRPRTVGKAA